MSDVNILENAIHKKAINELNARLEDIRDDWNLMFPTLHEKGTSKVGPKQYQDTAESSGSTIVTNCFSNAFPDTLGVRWGHASTEDMVKEYIQILMYAFEIWVVEPIHWKNDMLNHIEQGIVNNMMKCHQEQKKSVTIKGNFTVEGDDV